MSDYTAHPPHCPKAVEKQREMGRSEEAIASRSEAVRGMFKDAYAGDGNKGGIEIDLNIPVEIPVKTHR